MIEYPVTLWIVFSSLIGPGHHLPLPVDFFRTQQDCLQRIERNATDDVYHYECIEYKINSG